MRTLKTIVVASLVAASLYAGSGAAWARSDVVQRGTSWTDVGDPTIVPDLGISWESLPTGF